jgi:acyl carrier protein
MPNDLTARVIDVLTATQRLEPGRVTPDSTFEQLGIDSLDGMNIIFAIENEFGVDIPDDALPSLRSVRDIAEGLEKLIAAKGGS